jgi:hypothetical protein
VNIGDSLLYIALVDACAFAVVNLFRIEVRIGAELDLILAVSASCHDLASLLRKAVGIT